MPNKIHNRLHIKIPDPYHGCAAGADSIGERYAVIV